MVGGVEMQIFMGFLVALRAFVALAVFEPLRAFLGFSGIAIVSFSLVPVFVMPELSIVQVNSAELSQQWAGLETGKLVLSLMQQILMGVLLAAPLAIAIESFPLVGRIADLLRGTQFAEQVAPNLGNRVSALESAGTLLGCYLALASGGYSVLITAIKLSLANRGIFRQVSEITFDGMEFVRLSADTLSLGIVIAAPLIVAAILFEFSLVVASRFQLRTNLSSDLSPLKLICGLLLLAFALSESSNGETLFRAAYGLSLRLSHGQ